MNYEEYYNIDDNIKNESNNYILVTTYFHLENVTKRIVFCTNKFQFKIV